MVLSYRIATNIHNVNSAGWRRGQGSRVEPATEALVITKEQKVGGQRCSSDNSTKPHPHRHTSLLSLFSGGLPVTSSQVTTSIIRPELGPLPLSEPQDPESFNEFGSSDPGARLISLGRLERYKGGFQKYRKIL